MTKKELFSEVCADQVDDYKHICIVCGENANHNFVPLYRDICKSINWEKKEIKCDYIICEKCFIGGNYEN